MKELFINSSFKFISNNKKLDKYNEAKIKYGLEVMYHFFTKLFVILIISFFLKTINYIIPLFISFGALRTTGYGMHAKSNISCWISSLLFYVVFGLYIKYIDFNILIKMSLLILSEMSIILWSPSDTKGRPLINKNKRHYLKTLCIITGLIEILLSFNDSLYFKDVFVISMMFEAILVNPIVYKITKTPRNNYLNYM